MAKILFISIVRDGMQYLPRYFGQLESLTTDYKISLAITEGDSKDATYNWLCNQRPSFKVQAFKFDLNSQKYGSVDVADRWRNIATTWNWMLDQISYRFDDYDYVCYMEADLIWNKETIDKLVSGMENFDCVAPMSMLGNIFYDTWGHRSNGQNFVNQYPFHSKFLQTYKYMPIESAGSCILMKSFVPKICRLSLKDAMIGHDIVKNGFSFMLDKTAVVNHP